MKLRALRIENFRSMKSVEVHFEDDLTLVVGENDFGKSSLIDCIRVVTQGRSVDEADFTYGQTEMKLTVVVDDLEFEKSYALEDGRVSDLGLQARPTTAYISRLTEWLDSSGTDFSIDEDLESLKTTCRLFGIQVRSNSNPETLQSNLRSRLQDAADPNFVIEGAQFPSFNSIQLDGKHFENVSSFFKEAYLKEKQRSLWETPVDESKTILDTVNDAIDSYADEMNEQLESAGVKDKLRVFLPTLTDIKVRPQYTPQDFNLNATVLFLEGDGEIDLNKKGDGTKRRITMALLELKRDASLVGGDSSTVYLLDEPDTHLHVRAQMQLLETLHGFADAGNQVIVSTHSPFMINAVSPKQVRLLLSPETNRTQIKHLTGDFRSEERALRALGIENVYLFFARRIILVEGQTEEQFLHAYIPRLTGKDPASNLTKIVNVTGIGNVYGFSRALTEIHSVDRVFVLTDNDLSAEMEDLIRSLALPDTNRLPIGTWEFEDAFDPEVIFECWRDYVTECGKTVSKNWNLDDISALRNECADNSAKKYSKELSRLNSGSGVKMTKPLLGMVLGREIEPDKVPESITHLIRQMQNV